MIVTKKYAQTLIRLGDAEAWRTTMDGEVVICKIEDADTCEHNGDTYAIVLDIKRQRTLHVLI